jgi:putative SOS response-associated peptidase YedK
MGTAGRRESLDFQAAWLKSTLKSNCAFCEYADAKPRKTPVWFARDESRPLFAFAGVWGRWRGLRGPKSAPIEGEHELFAFLTAAPNAIVAPIHPKAMPVVLTDPAAFELWLTAETQDALTLQAPAPVDALRIVARGKREDP